MRNYQEKKGFSHILQSWPVMLCLFILLLFFTWGVIRFMAKLGETSKNRQISEMKVVELKEFKEKLSYDIEKLKTDEGLEESIREKFGLIKEGEGLIVVVDDKNAIPPQDDGGKNWFMLFLDNWFQ